MKLIFNKKRLPILVLLITAGLVGFNLLSRHLPGPTGNGKINWMTIEQAEEACRKNPRKIMVDVYTNWCGWCKRMDAETFTDSVLAAYINKNYYAVKLNAEGQDNIIFKEKVYRFNASYKANDLAVLLLNGQMGYPSFVFLDEKLNPLQNFSGYQKAPDFTFLAHYFAENAYKKKSLEEYKKVYFAEK